MDSGGGSFPRGGVGASNDDSSKKRRANPSNDVLFGGSKRTARIEVKVDKKKKKNGKSSDLTIFGTAPSLGALGVGLGMVSKTSMTDKIVKIDGLNFTKYLPGTMALGYVLQIKNNQLIISLPGGVTGIVPNYEVSDVMNRLVLDGGDSSGKKRKKDTAPTLNSIITVMQPVRVYVVEIKDPKLDKTVKLKKKTLILSMRQTLINRGLAFKHLVIGGQIYCCVKSREDHGYLLTNGMDGVNIFLPLKGLKTEYIPGQPLDCVIEDINDDSRIVTVKTNKKAVTNVTTLGSMIPFSCLSPGMLFDVLVERIIQNGVIVSFSSSFHGVIDNYSLPSILPDTEWAAKVPVGYTAKARIIYVDHANKGIRLSLRPHVVALAAPSDLPALGTTLDDLKIMHIKKSTGILLAGSISVNDSDDETKNNVGIFIHKSSLSDPSLVNDTTSKRDHNKYRIIDSSRLTKVYRVGRIVEKVRIVGYFLVEGWALASNVSHLMDDNSILHWSQVQVGTNLPVEIIAIKEFGLVLKLDNYEKVQATCPLLHTSETGQVLTKLDKKFKIGQKLVMRVWEVSNKKGAIIMSNKKRLIDDTNSPIASYSDCVEGAKALGVISKLSNSEGMRVHFYNSVKGTIPMSVLLKQGVNDLDESYRVGQVIKVSILRVNKNQVFLALDMGSDEKELSKLLGARMGSSASNDDADDIDVGQESDDDNDVKTTAHVHDFVSGVITKVQDEHVTLRLDDGRMGSMAKYHLFDQAKVANSILNNSDRSCFKVGDRIDDALVLSSTSEKAFITMKPLLLAIARANDSNQGIIPSRVTDVSAGQVVVGYITKVESFGVIVAFKDSLTALAPRPNIGEKFIATPVGLYSVGDSIRCLVQRVDNVREKIIITLKPLLLSPSSTSICDYVSTCVTEQYKHMIALNSANNNSRILAETSVYKVGNMVQGTVSAIKEYGIILISALDNTTVMLAKGVSSSKVKVGTTMKARILDVDYENAVLEVTLDEQLLVHDKAVIQDPKKKKKSRESEISIPVGSIVDGKVILMKEKYVIVYLTAYNVIAFVLVADYHTPYAKGTDAFVMNQVIKLRVDRVSSAANVGSSPYLPIITSIHREASAGLRSPHPQASLLSYDKFVQSLRVGSLLKWKVNEITLTEVKVDPDIEGSNDGNYAGVIPLSLFVSNNDFDDNLASVLKEIQKVDVKNSVHKLHPFYGISKGASIQCRVMQIRKHTNTNDVIVYLSYDKRGHAGDSASFTTKLLQWQGANSLKVNRVYMGVITDKTDAYVQVQLSPYITTKLHYVEVSRDTKLISQFKQHSFIGQKLVVGVTNITSKDNKFQCRISRLHIEDRLGSLASENETIEYTTANHQVGDLVISQVDKEAKWILNPPALMVRIPGNTMARVCVTELDDKVSWGTNDSNSNKLKHGDIVLCRLLELNAINDKTNSKSKSTIEASLRASRVVDSLRKKDSVAMDPLPVEGELIKAVVTNVSSKGCFVRISRNVTGRILMKDLSDDFVEDPSVSYPSGSVLTARIMKFNHATNTTDLSLKQSDIDGNTVADKELSSLQEGKIVKGTIQNITESGLFINIHETSLVGLARKHAVIDENNKSNLADLYEINDVVKCKILSVNKGSKKVALGLKPSYFSRNKDNDESGQSTNDDESSEDDDGDNDEGDDDDGDDNDDNDDDDSAADDDNVDDDSDDSDDDEDDEERYLEPMDDDSDEELENMIKASAMKIDDEEGEDDDNDSDDSDDSDGSDAKEDNEDDEEEDDDSDDEEEVAESAHKKLKSRGTSVSESSDGSDDEKHTNNFFSSRLSSDKATISGAIGGSSLFQWRDFKPVTNKSEVTDGKGSGSDSDDDDDHQASKKRQKSKEKDARRSEVEVSKREHAISQGTLVPETAQDFNRLLLASPNSSYLWIQFISYYLMSANIDGARSIAERALSTISFREEDEKYNIWITYLNTEYKFGNNSTFEKVFTRAVNESKGKYIHLYVASLYEREPDNHTNVINMFEKTLKKYKYSKKVWMQYQHYLIKRGDSKVIHSLTHSFIHSFTYSLIHSLIHLLTHLLNEGGQAAVNKKSAIAE